MHIRLDVIRKLRPVIPAASGEERYRHIDSSDDNRHRGPRGGGGARRAGQGGLHCSPSPATEGLHLRVLNLYIYKRDFHPSNY